ncbi:MAG: hypothetical protein P4L92_06080 [Rudaea sp.]|nr:hypothetical protein [Rudaea sp.]
MRMQILAGGLLLAIGAAVAPVNSHAAVGVVIGVAPPVAPVEVIPAARVGYDWTPGYWHWNGYRHVWVSGYWLRSRPGWHWVAPRWSAYGPRWRYSAGYWAR